MTSFTRISAMTRKEFIHLLRDRRTLAVVLVMPVLQMLLFAYAISFDVKNVSTVIIDTDQTPASQAYVRSYASSDFFRVVGTANDLGAVDRVFDHNQARIAVVVPSGFDGSWPPVSVPPSRSTSTAASRRRPGWGRRSAPRSTRCTGSGSPSSGPMPRAST